MVKHEMLKGTVIWFSGELGYGFVKRDDGKPDLFVHYTAIQNIGFKKLEKEQRVEFLVEEGQQGLQASIVITQEGETK